MNKWTVLIESKEVLSSGGAVVTAAGQKFWLARINENVVTTTAVPYREDKPAPKGILTWDTAQSAVCYAHQWCGDSWCPWWVNPNGTVHVLQVKPRMVQDGWEIA